MASDSKLMPGGTQTAYRIEPLAMFGEEWVGIIGAITGTGVPVQCPCCNYGCVHHEQPPYVIEGEDDYRAGWGGRGDLVVVPFLAECGSHWDLCFGFHKGMMSAFIRVRVNCRELTAEEKLNLWR